MPPNLGEMCSFILILRNYNKGQKLYKNFFSHKDHQRIHDVIAQEIAAPWIITYDDVGEIARLYADFAIRKFDLTYSAANEGD